MRLARFSTVRGRLLALLIAIAVPIGALATIAAVTTYRTVVGAIETAQEQAATDFVIRTRVWFRSARRAMLVAGATLESASAGTACGSTVDTMLKRIDAYEAALFVLHDGRRCQGSSNAAGLEPAILSQLADDLRARGLSARGADRVQARYDQVRVGERNLLAVYLAVEDPASALREALLLIDPAVLDTVFELGETGKDMNVALVAGGQQIVASRGENGSTRWLPREERIPDQSARWQAQSLDGTDRDFAARLVTAPDFYVIASFDDVSRQAARLQFAVLLLTPLLTLAILCLVYMRAIDRHCVRWLRSIEATARARASHSPERAVILPDMPSEVRSVAEAFNAMIDEQEVRQRKLSTALDDNRFLVRELHHRVKNSLQVVQSYIGLAKRDYPSEARLALADAECHVHVLSSAYRFTLADGEMHPVRVDLFMEDVLGMISNLVRRRDQWVGGRIDTSATLSVDRIIPLGFLVVDVATRALRARPGLGVTIGVRDLDPDTIEVWIETSEAIDTGPPPRLFAGLVAQIETQSASGPEGRSLGSWRIRHRGRDHHASAASAAS